MEDLPYDILAHIFLCTWLKLNDKLAISAVSRHLRRAALDTRLLWSSIEVSTERDLLFLEHCILRDQEALFDVTVRPHRRNLAMTPKAVSCYAALVSAALVPHAARLRSLAVYAFELHELSPLLCSDLVFESLRTHLVHGHPLKTEYPIVALCAPQLEVLDLDGATAKNLSVLAPRAKDMTLDLDYLAEPQTVMDGLVAHYGPTLRRLTLSGKSQNDERLMLKGPWLFPCLQRLDITLSSTHAVEMLNGITTAHIPYVRVGVLGRIVEEWDYHTVVYPAIAPLLHGAGDIVEFSVIDRNKWGEISSSRIVTCSGHRRSLDVISALYPATLTRVWEYLCDNFRAAETVRTVECTTTWWELFCAVFAARPPAGPSFTLRIAAGWHTPKDFTPLELPTLSKVVFIGTDGRLEGHKRAILWLARGALKCSRAQVELCTCGLSRPRAREIVNELRGWLREELQPEGCLSVGVGCVIRWILCPGI